jgi:hypothetical protein
MIFFVRNHIQILQIIFSKYFLTLILKFFIKLKVVFVVKLYVNLKSFTFDIISNVIIFVYS